MSSITVPKQRVVITSIPVYSPDNTILDNAIIFSTLWFDSARNIPTQWFFFFPQLFRESKFNVNTYFLKYRDIFCDILKWDGPSLGSGQHTDHTFVSSNGLC